MNGYEINLHHLTKAYGSHLVLQDINLTVQAGESVTHDVSEAVYLADRVVLIEDGHIRMNQPIELSRPHGKGPETIQYEKHILDGIMKPQKKII